MEKSAACPICKWPCFPSGPSSFDGANVDCERCGSFGITHTAAVNLQQSSPDERDLISHAVCRLTSRAAGARPRIDSGFVDRVLKEMRLSIPTDQADNLILWLGARDSPAMDAADLALASVASIAGSRADPVAVGRLLRQMEARQWIDSPRVNDVLAAVDGLKVHAHLALTFAGWDRYAALSRTAKDTRKAFMAMAFGSAWGLPEAYRDCFKPAVAAAGFHLERLDEGQGAGLIDDQLRVAIRTSRFLIADLTTLNRGAYWEAGFAEGLGRPVIYVCHGEVWHSKDPQVKPHFDTNHLRTVIWSPAALPAAQAELTAMIRNTFPVDAKMED